MFFANRRKFMVSLLARAAQRHFASAQSNKPNKPKFTNPIDEEKLKKALGIFIFGSMISTTAYLKFIQPSAENGNKGESSPILLDRTSATSSFLQTLQRTDKHIVAITGVPGSGKSSFVQLIKNNLSRERHQVVLLQEHQIIGGYRNIADTIGVSQTEKVSSLEKDSIPLSYEQIRKSVLQKCEEYFAGKGKLTYFILDNVEDKDELTIQHIREHFMMPNMPDCVRVIITSRSNMMKDDVRCLQCTLQSVSVEDAVQFIMKFLKKFNKPRNAQEVKDFLLQLQEKFGVDNVNIPLVLNLIGNSLKNLSLSTILSELLKAPPKETKDSLPDLLCKCILEKVILQESNVDLTSTPDQKATKKSDNWKLLNYLCRLPGNIPLAFLQSLDEMDEKSLTDALSYLEQLSMITKVTNSNGDVSYCMHREVQHAVWKYCTSHPDSSMAEDEINSRIYGRCSQQLEEMRSSSSNETVASFLNDMIETLRAELLTHELCESKLKFLDTFLKKQDIGDHSSPPLAEPYPLKIQQIYIMHRLAVWYVGQEKYSTAERLYVECIAKEKAILGVNHPDTLITMADLAYLYDLEGKYDMSVALYKECYTKRMAVLGGNHPETLTIMNNLGLVYQKQGKYDIAESYFKECLKKLKVVHGVYHPHTLNTMNNLATVYDCQGKYKAAETLYKECLKLLKQTVGVDHPDTLSMINNLAILFHNEGKYDLAETLFRECLLKRKAVLGSEHQDTLSSMNDLAALYDSQGKYDQAETLYQECLSKRMAIFGANHPNSLMTINNLAAVYDKQGKYDLAESLYTDCFTKRKVVLGANHPDTLTTMNNLAALYDSQGKYDQAETLYQDCFAKQRLLLGPTHPDTLKTMSNLTVVYTYQGRYEEAETVCKECLAKRKTVLGVNHPSTLTTMGNLAAVYERQEKFPLAEALYKECLTKQQSVLTGLHPETLMTMHSLAEVYAAQGKYKLAEALFADCLEKWKKALGEDHSDTMETKNSLENIRIISK